MWSMGRGLASGSIINPYIPLKIVHDVGGGGVFVENLSIERQNC